MKTRRLLWASFAVAAIIALLASLLVQYAWTGPDSPVDRATVAAVLDVTACADEAYAPNSAPFIAEPRMARLMPGAETHSTTLLQSFLRVSMNGPQGP